MPDDTQQGSDARPAATAEATVSAPGKPDLPPSGPDVPDLKTLQAKAHAHGRTAERRELLAKYNLAGEEELGAIVAAHRQVKDQVAAKEAADREEREQLATGKIAAERRIRELEPQVAQLAQLRKAMLEGEVKAAALAAGAYQDQIDLILYSTRDAVAWNADFSGLVVKSLENPDEQLDGLPALFEQLKKKRAPLFESDARRGAGFRSGDRKVGGRGEQPKKLSTLEERARWGKG